MLGEKVQDESVTRIRLTQSKGTENLTAKAQNIFGRDYIRVNRVSTYANNAETPAHSVDQMQQ